MSTDRVASAGINWHTSRSCEGGACVGVARQGEFILVGNTANPGSPISRFTVQEWDAFIAGVKLGDFDDLA
jgi:predicted secreted Zn-dependent protease